MRQLLLPEEKCWFITAAETKSNNKKNTVIKLLPVITADTEVSFGKDSNEKISSNYMKMLLKYTVLLLND